VSAGFYFRAHYFILLLPAVAMLGGVAVSRGIYLVKHDRSLELLLAVPVLLLVGVGVGMSLVNWGTLWFTLSPTEASARIYGTTLFCDAAKAADYINERAPKNARIAVLGSEPEIYFYSHRRSATGFIYAYPLMETHPYALKLQEQMIEEIQTARPEFMVFVKEPLSWLARSNSERRVFSWWERYWTDNYDLVKSISVSSERDTESLVGESILPAENGPGRNFLLILKRKS
jgi:hypothetical protein